MLETLHPRYICQMAGTCCLPRMSRFLFTHDLSLAVSTRGQKPEASSHLQRNTSRTCCASSKEEKTWKERDLLSLPILSIIVSMISIVED
jgi:hypothetical protein